MHSLIFVFVAELVLSASNWEKTNVGFHCLPNDWCDQKECTNKGSQGVATFGAFAKRVSSENGKACLERVSADKDCGDYAFSKAGHCFCTRASGSNDCVRTATWAGAYEVHTRDCYEKQANTGCAYTVGSLSIDNGKSYSVSGESSCKKICDASSDCVAFEYFHYGQHSGGPMKQGTGTCYYYGGTVMGTSDEPNRSCFVKKGCAEAKLALESEQASKSMAEFSLSKTTNVNLPVFVTYLLAAVGFLSVLYVGAKYGSKAFSEGDYAEVGNA